MNGTRVLNTTGAGTVTASSSAVTIGDFGTAGFEYTGYISNLRLVNGTAIYANSTTCTVPTTPLTAVTNTSLLTCQSNRFIDNSTNAFAITTTGSPSVQRFNPFGASTAYSTSVIGGSGYFDGTGDYLSLANNSNLDLGAGDFTLEVWIYRLNTSGAKIIWSQWNNNGDNASQLLTNGSSFIFRIGATQWSFGSFIANSWTHVAVSRSGSTVTMFVNGAVSSTQTNSTDVTTTSQTVLGANDLGATPANFFSGYMAGFRQVKGTAVYTSAFTPPTSPPTAITNTQLLTNFTNGAIFDNAMMNNLETVGNAQISTSVKKYGTGSLAFDGTGDYLQAPDSPVFNLGSGNWTIESWIYLNSAKNYNGFYGKRQAGQFGLALQIDSSGVLSISASTTGSSWALGGASLGSGYTTGAWMHVAVTRSGTTITGWLNGTSTGTQTLSGSIFAATGYPAVIGSAFDTGTAQDLNGYMDDFRLTNGFCRYTTTFTPATSAFSDTGPY
tara:strand:- start:51 stop:1544 length:1494 start_codon:yes stop_codon:yes gene_type:complete